MEAQKLVILFVVVIATTTTTGEHINQNKIWSIAIGHDFTGHEYFDTDGYLKGFGLQMIDLVCKAGNMDCRIVWDLYVKCWDGSPGKHPSGGVGLMSGWYDACTAWVPTVERIHTFAFTKSYLENQKSYFYTLKDNNFDATDLSTKTIGFHDGWATSEQCLARQRDIRGSILPTNRIKHYGYPEDSLKALKDRNIDAVFTSEGTWSVEQMKQLTQLPKAVFCFLDGNAMMARKDSTFPIYWNTAFEKLRDGGKWNKFCVETNKEHAHKGEVACKQL